MFLFLLFVLGAVVGSFVNALVYRLQNKKRIGFDRSICPFCGHQLSWSDLIPIISFCILKGRCRYCSRRISWQYPAVELVAGTAFILPIWGLEGGVLSLDYYIYLIFAVILVIIFAYDLRYMLIPDRISIPAVLAVVVIQLFVNYQLLITSYFLAAVVASGFFFLQFVVSKGRWIGGGDIRLGFLIGLMLGWPNILLGIFLAYIVGTIITLPLVIAGYKSMTSKVPFGVYLAVAAIFTLLYGADVIKWYLEILR